MIATVICTRSLVFLVAKMGAFSLVFATSFAKKFPLGDREFSGFGIEFEFPSAFVGGVVMPRAKWDHVVEVGRTTIFPVFNVVHVAVIEDDFTIRDCTRWIYRFECPSLVHSC